MKAGTGRPDLAVEHIARARRLSPNDPQDFSIHTAMGFAHFVAGRYEEGMASAQAAVRDRPGYQLANCILAANAALAGQPIEARKAIERVLKATPGLRMADARFLQTIGRAEDLARWAEALRLAGLPE